MYKDILQSIDNVAIWPVISFVIFFTFFLVLLWWTLSVDKGFIRKMKDLPMEGNLTQPNSSSHEIKG
jgi:cytochrome c oxidase cbb3-type subunit 4